MGSAGDETEGSFPKRRDWSTYERAGDVPKCQPARRHL